MTPTTTDGRGMFGAQAASRFLARLLLGRARGVCIAATVLGLVAIAGPARATSPDPRLGPVIADMAAVQNQIWARIEEVKGPAVRLANEMYGRHVASELSAASKEGGDADWNLERVLHRVEGFGPVWPYNRWPGWREHGPWGRGQKHERVRLYPRSRRDKAGRSTAWARRKNETDALAVACRLGQAAQQPLVLSEHEPALSHRRGLQGQWGGLRAAPAAAGAGRGRRHPIGR